MTSIATYEDSRKANCSQFDRIGDFIVQLYIVLIQKWIVKPQISQIYTDNITYYWNFSMHWKNYKTQIRLAKNYEQHSGILRLCSNLYNVIGVFLNLPLPCLEDPARLLRELSNPLMGDGGHHSGLKVGPRTSRGPGATAVAGRASSPLDPHNLTYTCQIPPKIP